MMSVEALLRLLLLLTMMTMMKMEEEGEEVRREGVLAMRQT